jgi:phage terminase small subunit
MKDGGKHSYGDWREDKPEEYRKALFQLTEFQRRFVEGYLESGEATEAARIAGSKAKNIHQVGWNTLNNENVQKAIALGLNTMIQAAALNSTEIVNNFRNIFMKAMEEGKYAEANKATEHLGRILGLFQDKNKSKAAIEEKARELREDKQVDNDTQNMLEILGKARTRVGTKEDPVDLDALSQLDDEVPFDDPILFGITDSVSKGVDKG